MGGQGGRCADHGQYLQAIQEELHAAEIEEHLAVVGRLVRDVPQGAPGELHHLVTLKGEAGSAQLTWRAPQALAPVRASPNKTWVSSRGKPSRQATGGVEWLHEGSTYYLVQQLLLNQLQHGLWAEKRTCGGTGLKSYVSPKTQDGERRVSMSTPG